MKYITVKYSAQVGLSNEEEVSFYLLPCSRES